MYLLPHVCTGILIASKIQNPWLAIPFSFLSHFILDAIPHATISVRGVSQRKNDFLVLVADIFLAIAVTLFFSLRTEIFSDQFWLINFCSLFTVLPDAVRFPYYFLNFRPKSLEVWEKIHQKIDQDVRHNTVFHGNQFLGTATQLIIIILSLWFVIR